MTAFAYTARQKAVLDAITASINANGIAPSIREIAIAAGFSPKSKGPIIGVLRRLEERGLIHRLPNHARAIALGPRPEPACCPHCHRSLEAA